MIKRIGIVVALLAVYGLAGWAWVQSAPDQHARLFRTVALTRPIDTAAGYLQGLYYRHFPDMVEYVAVEFNQPLLVNADDGEVVFKAKLVKDPSGVEHVVVGSVVVGKVTDRHLVNRSAPVIFRDSRKGSDSGPGQRP